MDNVVVKKNRNEYFRNYMKKPYHCDICNSDMTISNKIDHNKSLKHRNILKNNECDEKDNKIVMLNKKISDTLFQKKCYQKQLEQFLGKTLE